MREVRLASAAGQAPQGVTKQTGTNLSITNGVDGNRDWAHTLSMLNADANKTTDRITNMIYSFAPRAKVLTAIDVAFEKGQISTKAAKKLEGLADWAMLK